MSSRLKKRRKPWTRRLIALLLVVSICASFLPLPMDASVEKDTSVPFPCQNRPCGCRSAAQCWKSCCCFNNTQKLAWAKENRVSVPEFVVEAAAEEKRESERRVSCCVGGHEERVSLPCSASVSTHSDCGDDRLCEHSHDDDTSKNTDSDDDNTHETPTLVIGALMLGCQGQGLYSYSLPSAVMPVVPQVTDRGTRSEWEPPASEILHCGMLEPPVPPPKLSGGLVRFA